MSDFNQSDYTRMERSHTEMLRQVRHPRFYSEPVGTGFAYAAWIRCEERYIEIAQRGFTYSFKFFGMQRRHRTDEEQGQ